MDWNHIPVLPEKGHVSGWTDQVVTFRSQSNFDTFMEIWNPSEEFKVESAKELI